MSVWNPDVFNRFKDDSGNYKEFLGKDVQGMLSLYEASYLAFEGENLLDEALAFTRMHLKDLKRDVSKSIAEQISHALEVPLHHRMLRLEARWYIEAYGLGHRFEKDIARALVKFASSKGCNERVEKSLHATALSFRLLRQHGYEVSQDVFNRFKDDSGNYKEFLGKDVQGMLSLYEASYLAFEGENLLDEALAFTRMHLKDLKRDVSKSIAEQISHALEVPLHHRMLRLEARWYIEAYGKREDANGVLLELAKLDFNIVQSVHQTELQEMSRWWKGSLANKLSFSRDRLMECFFWTVGMAYEPQFSHLRKGLTKVFSLITAIDDVYDVYGTLDELELFTDAVERWDISVVKNLPNSMKLSFLALYNTVNEMAYDNLKENEEDSLPFLTKAWADMLKAFLQEAKWSYNKDMPTFRDYLDNAWAELETGKTANAIHCYMRETSLSEKRACKDIRNMVDRTWKKINEEQVVDSSFGEPFVELAINLARTAQCTYQYGDGLGAPDEIAKNRVLSLMIEPVSLI
nr:putative terpene synthase 12 [Quercus suber]